MATPKPTQSPQAERVSPHSVPATAEPTNLTGASNHGYHLTATLPVEPGQPSPATGGGMSEQCGEPYPHLGDIRACPLDASHDDTCEHANHQAWLAAHPEPPEYV